MCGIYQRNTHKKAPGRTRKKKVTRGESKKRDCSSTSLVEMLFYNVFSFIHRYLSGP
jgi:hypothetical protein